MADSFTPNLNLRKPEVGAALDTWGGTAGLNSDLDLIDAIFLATGLGTSVGMHVGNGKVLKVDGTGQLVTTDFEFHDVTDTTKVVNLSAAGVTTATTRTIDFPNATGTLALTTDVTKRAPRGTILYGYYGAVAPEGTLFLNGTSFGKGTSAATQRANDDTFGLYDHFWTTLGATPTGGRGANALADWNANKVMPLPDHRGRTTFALDNNGGIATANVLQPGVAAGQAIIRMAPVGAPTEQANIGGVGVTVSVPAAGLGGSISGNMSTFGSSGPSSTADGATGGYSVDAHSHVVNSNGFAVGISGTAFGSGSINGGSLTAAVTNVPTGMMSDCVIVM